MLQSLDTEKYTAAPDPTGSYAFKKKKKKLSNFVQS